MPLIPNVPVDAFQRAANVSRSTLYLTDADPQMPINLHEDARTPFLGFCGRNWRSGGTVLIAINPGGGGEKYQARTPQDEELIPLIHAFKSAPPTLSAQAFERMCASYCRQVQTWNLWRILAPTLEACRSPVEEICYLNIFPYRTAGDAKPTAVALRNAWNLIALPLLKALQPGRLVALGKKAGDTAGRLHAPPPSLYVVPRTIGDTYVSREASVVLDQLRSAT